MATFTANASSNVTANISVPTKVSELTNDSGFITSSGSCNYANYSGYVQGNKSTGLYVESVKYGNALVTTNQSGFGAIFNAPTKNYRIGCATYPNNDDTLLFYSVTNANVSSSTNTVNKSMSWNGGTGILTATGFSGPLTGNVTGNCSGSSGSCSGNAATATKATYNANGKELVNSIIKGLSVSGRTITYTKLDGTTGTLTTQDTTYSHPTSSGNKHIPSGGSSGQFLGWSADGTAKWVNNPNTNTWTAMVGATSSANGSVGYVNAVPPKDGYNTKYLRADGTWQVPPDHTYTVNNATLTIQKNGTTVKTFTANASSNVTCNITVPTNTNQLTNGNGFITSEIDSQSLGTSGWIRFKNGLQICWELGINRKSLGALYSWNKAFSAVFVAIASDVGPDNGNAVQHLSDTVCIRPYSATQYRLGGYIAAAPDKTDFWIQYIAIGKWK